MIVTYYCSIFCILFEKKKRDILLIRVKLEYFFFLSEYTISKLSVRLLENMLLKLIRLQISSRITWAWDETVEVKDFANMYYLGKYLGEY